MTEFDPHQLLAPLNPEERALNRLFQANVDEGVLPEIAAADYGWKAHECYALLQPILNAGLVAADDSDLREVLELIRWSEPGDPKWGPGGHGPRGHWMRLFACAALLRLAPTNPDAFYSECDTLAQFSSSAIELGRPVASAAASLLAWRFVAYPGDTVDAPFLAFAILLLVTLLESREGRGPWLKDLATWVHDQEQHARNAISQWNSSLLHGERWLLGLTNFDQREAVWRDLADRILVRPERAHSPEACMDLQLLGELVVGT